MDTGFPCKLEGEMFPLACVIVFTGWKLRYIKDSVFIDNTCLWTCTSKI